MTAPRSLEQELFRELKRMIGHGTLEARYEPAVDALLAAVPLAPQVTPTRYQRMDDADAPYAVGGNSVDGSVDLHVPTVFGPIPAPLSAEGIYGDFVAEVREAAITAGWDGMRDLQQWVIERVAAPAPAQGWQPIATAPKEYVSVLLYCAPFVREGYHDGKVWVTLGRGLPSAWTHWMPLPAPPSAPTPGQEAPADAP